MKRLERELMTAFDGKLQAIGLTETQRAILKEKTLRIASEEQAKELIAEVHNAIPENATNTQL